MDKHLINTESDFISLKKYVEVNKYGNGNAKVVNGCYELSFNEFESFFINMSHFDKSKRDEINVWVKCLSNPSEPAFDSLIFGKDETTHIVSCEVTENGLEIFTEKEGVVTSEMRPNKLWIVSPTKLDRHFEELEGGLHYKYIKYYKNPTFFYLDRNLYKTSGIFSVADGKENSMLLQGFTYYKGMKVPDVSTLFFDIETTGLVQDKTSKVLLISNCYVNNGVVTRKLFSYDEYPNDRAFIDAWCEWVREVNPSIMCGHNIFSYDLPYLAHCAKRAYTKLNLGRNGAPIKFDRNPSAFRKDGSQSYPYVRCHIYGREIIDGLFLAIKFDIGRRYESYALKQIIKQEGLEVSGRQFYEAGTIKDNYLIPEEWERIKLYSIHDADDSKSLYDLMIAPFFYLNQSIPKSSQMLGYSATGSQINAFLIRSYLQMGHSLPQASPDKKYQGAISFGNPGIYKHVFKVDVASLYPSIMLQYKVFDELKDPLQHFYKMVEYFTRERLANKKKAKETGDRYFKDVEQAGKQIINSAYGMLGARGLMFNSPDKAAFVTEMGREVLKKAILWATGKEYEEKEIVCEETDVEEQQ